MLYYAPWLPSIASNTAAMQPQGPAEPAAEPPAEEEDEEGGEGLLQVGLCTGGQDAEGRAPPGGRAPARTIGLYEVVMGENDELVFQPVDKGTLGDIRRMFVPCRMSNATEDINQRFIKQMLTVAHYALESGLPPEVAESMVACRDVVGGAVDVSQRRERTKALAEVNGHNLPPGTVIECHAALDRLARSWQALRQVYDTSRKAGIGRLMFLLPEYLAKCSLKYLMQVAGVPLRGQGFAVYRVMRKEMGFWIPRRLAGGGGGGDGDGGGAAGGGGGDGDGGGAAGGGDDQEQLRDDQTGWLVVGDGHMSEEEAGGGHDEAEAATHEEPPGDLKGGAGTNNKGAAAAGGAAKPDAARVRAWRLDGRQGVSSIKSGKRWQVQIHYGKQLYLGCFKTEEEAIACYVLAEDRIAAGCHPETGKYVPEAERPKPPKKLKNNAHLLGKPAQKFSDAALGERATDFAAKVDAGTLDIDQVAGVGLVKATGKSRAYMKYKKKLCQLGSQTTDLAEAIRYRLLAEKAIALFPDKNPQDYVAARMAAAGAAAGAAGKKRKRATAPVPPQQHPRRRNTAPPN